MDSIEDKRQNIFVSQIFLCILFLLVNSKYQNSFSFEMKSKKKLTMFS